MIIIKQFLSCYFSKIIWLGDLNYRLVADSCDCDTHELLKKHDWQTLLKKDQVRPLGYYSVVLVIFRFFKEEKS